MLKKVIILLLLFFVCSELHAQNSRDVEVNSFLSSDVCRGSNKFLLLIKNHGIDTLHKVSIVIQKGQSSYASIDTFQWNGALLTDSTTVVTLPSINHTSVTRYRFFTYKPNDLNDQNLTNDTLTTKEFSPALKGRVVLGGSNPSYANINLLINDLYTNGICGPLRVELLYDTLKAQINLLQNIKGLSKMNHLKFVSGQKNKTIVTYNSTSIADNWVVKSKNQSYLIFDSLIFLKNSKGFGNIFTLEESNNDLTISNCSIIGLDSALDRSLSNLINYSAANKSNNYKISLVNNSFINGAEAMRFRSIIDTIYYNILNVNNNKFINQALGYGSIFGLDSFSLINNLIENEFGGFGTDEVNFQLIKDNNIKIGGKNNLISGGSGFKIGVNGKKPSYIINNFVSVLTYGSTRGMLVEGDSNVYIYNNTVVVSTNRNLSEDAFYLNVKSSPCEIKNNSISNFGYSHALTGFWNDSQFKIENNHIYSNGGALVESGIQTQTHLLNIKEFEVFNPGVNKSIGGEPFYYSYRDHNIRSTSEKLDGKGQFIDLVKYDIDGEKRDTGACDIGADEFTILKHEIQLTNYLGSLDYCATDKASIRLEILNRGLELDSSLFFTSYIYGADTQVVNYKYSKKLKHATKDTIQIPSFSTLKGGVYKIVTYHSLRSDYLHYNDTLGYLSDTVKAFSSYPTFKPINICKNDTGYHNLVANGGPFVNYNWYDDKELSNLLFQGKNFNTKINKTDTFYFKGDEINSFSAGIPTINQSNGAYSRFVHYGLKFEVFKEVELQDFTVYAQSLGDVVINIYGYNFNYTKTFKINSIGKNVLMFGEVLPKGKYVVEAKGSTVTGLFRNLQGANYPYLDPNGWISIYEYFPGNSSFPNFYYNFYDWHISDPKACSSPVYEVIANVIESPILEEIDNVTLCKGDSIILSNPSKSTNLSWIWKSNGNKVVSNDSFYQTPRLNKREVFVLRDTMSNGCTSEQEVVINVDTMPEFDLIQDTLVCSGGGVSFDYSGVADSLFWFSDSTSNAFFKTGPKLNIDHITSDTSFYLKASKGPCLSAYHRMIVFVQTPTSAPILDSVYSICEGDTQNIKASGSNIKWYKPGTFELLDTGLVFSTERIFRTDSLYLSSIYNGCYSDTIKVKLLALEKPIKPTVIDTVICEGTLSKIFSQVQDSLYWYTNNNSFIGYFDTLNVQLGNKDTLFFTRSFDGNCLSDISSAMVKVNLIAIKDSIIGVCNNDSLSIKLSGLNQRYSWYNNSNDEKAFFVGNPILFKSVIKTDTFFVEHFGGSCADKRGQIIVNSSKKIPVSISKNEKVCYGTSAELKGFGAEGDITWYDNSELKISIGRTFNTPKIFNQDTFLVRVNNNGCIGTMKEVIVKLEERVDPDFSSDIQGARVILDSKYGNGFYHEWRVIDSIYKGVQSPFIDFQVNGKFKITHFITDLTTKCLDSTSSEIFINTVSDKEIEGVKFSLYPNPNIGYFTLEKYDNTQDGVVKLYDIHGKQVLLKKDIKDGITFFKLSLASGIYFLEYKSNSAFRVRKIILK